MTTNIKHCLPNIKHCLTDESNDVIPRMKSSSDTASVAIRITQAIAQSGKTSAELAAECDVTPQAVNSWKKTGRISKGQLSRLAELTGKSVDWLIRGAEEPTTSGGGLIISARPITVYTNLDELPPESTVLVKRIDVALSAGKGRQSWHIEEKEPLPFQADYIRRLDAKPKNLVAVKVNGDSMEPRLFDDDTVLVDSADKRIPANGGVFALVYAGEMLVKRLRQLPNGDLKIISDNAERYEAITVSADDVEHIHVVGRVKYRSGMGDF